MAERLTRIGIGVLGVIAAAWGLRLMRTQGPIGHKFNFAEWLIGGVLLHDLILASVVVLVGWLLARVLPPHLRGFVQGALVVIALTGSMAFFVVWRQGTAQRKPSLALLQQNYLANFAIIVAVVIACTGVLYALSLRNMRKSRSE